MQALMSHLAQVADLFVGHFHKHLYDEVDSLWWVSVDLHEADAAGQEVHEEAEERCHIVDLRCFCDAAQSFQSGNDLLLHGFLLTDLGEVLLVNEVEEALLEWMQYLQCRDRVMRLCCFIYCFVFSLAIMLDLPNISLL